MNYILFDGPHRNALLPFTFTRPVADIRVGILTIREKWEKMLGSTTTSITEDYLSEKWPMVEMESNVMINASFLPNDILVAMIKNLEINQAIFQEEEVVAFFAKEGEEVDFDDTMHIEILLEDACEVRELIEKTLNKEKDELYQNAQSLWKEYINELKEAKYNFQLNRPQHKFLTELVLSKLEYDVNSVFFAIEDFTLSLTTILEPLTGIITPLIFIEKSLLAASL